MLVIKTSLGVFREGVSSLFVHSLSIGVMDKQSGIDLKLLHEEPIDPLCNYYLVVLLDHKLWIY